MEVILLNDIEKIGLRGEVVNVARGYARNFLLPRRLAEIATPAKVAELQKRDAQRARHEARSFEQAQEMAETLSATALRFDVKAGPTGALFGSVTPTDIADELWRVRKIRVDRRKIGIDTIKRIGRHEVPIELFQDVTVTVRAAVVPEGGELPSEEELAAMESAERAEEAAAEPEPSQGALEAVLAAETATTPEDALDAAATAPEEAAEPELEAPEAAWPEFAAPEAASPDTAPPEAAWPEFAPPETAQPEAAPPEDAAASDAPDEQPNEAPEGEPDSQSA